MGKGSAQIRIQRRHMSGKQAHEKWLNTTSHQTSANQNHKEIMILYPLRGLESKRYTITNVDEDIEKLEPSDTSGRKVKWHSGFGKKSGGFQKV